MIIITIADGIPTSILVWGGDLLTIHGMTLGTIPGFIAAGTARGTTVAGMIPGFTAMVAGMVGAAPGAIADGIHPGTMAVGLIPGTMDTADTGEAVITTASMMVITVA